MEVRFRPLTAWPRPETANRRWHPFPSVRRGGWNASVGLLRQEIGRIDGDRVIVGTFHAARDIRADGWPRADAREPRHPGVEISFDSRYGRLVYATDVCQHWEDNVRSVALGLEALRAVDRYGVGTRGEQYAGWRALPSGAGVVIASADEALAILAEAAGRGPGLTGSTREEAERLYRIAVKRVHPDAGGSPEEFLRVRAAWEMLRGVA